MIDVGLHNSWNHQQEFSTQDSSVTYSGHNRTCKRRVKLCKQFKQCKLQRDLPVALEALRTNGVLRVSVLVDNY